MRSFSCNSRLMFFFILCATLKSLKVLWTWTTKLRCVKGRVHQILTNDPLPLAQRFPKLWVEIVYIASTLFNQARWIILTLLFYRWRGNKKAFPSGEKATLTSMEYQFCMLFFIVDELKNVRLYEHLYFTLILISSWCILIYKQPQYSVHERIFCVNQKYSSTPFLLDKYKTTPRKSLKVRLPFGRHGLFLVLGQIR